ncbi:MAG TPA: TAXI family TRAP transporter solute-binding subunit [Burkholderiales bacterium]|nr:TAXI family TRAP transporter solute-binding subunit [Burkholderiales bacterium]
MRSPSKSIVAILLAGAALLGAAGCGEQKKMLAIGSGGTGGVYYPLGGALANMLSANLPGLQATAEVTGGSVDNLKLVGTGRADIGFSMVDAAWDAYNGTDKFSSGRLPVRTLAVLYPNRMHAVTVASTGIKSMQDLKGRRVSVGSAGSATEIMALRVLEAYGLQDALIRERLSVAESVNALKDGKIEAFFWAGGLPTAAVTDLAASPGSTIRLLDHADAVARMNEKYGPLYNETVIGKDVYTGMSRDNRNATVWNVLVVAADMPDDLAHDIVRLLFERKQDLVVVHKEAGHLDLGNQSAKLSPVPFHPGALRYYREQGVKVE